MSDTPRYDALLKESMEETARFCATQGTLRVWEALESVERRNAELLLALKSARVGFGMAHDCIRRKFYDEALLHTGMGEANASRAINEDR